MKSSAFLLSNVSKISSINILSIKNGAKGKFIDLQSITKAETKLVNIMVVEGS